MTATPKWQFDETRQYGVDYADLNIVTKYDKDHRRYRDYVKFADDIIASLNLGPEHTVVDLGSGTGAFVRRAAGRIKKIYAVDVSAAMLEYLKEKAIQDNLNNIEYHQAGYLTYQHDGKPVDAVVSVFSFHHLPDFWKQEALHRIAAMLKPGGKMYLEDVVYPSRDWEYKTVFDQWIAETETSISQDFADEIVIHIRDEFSTFDWMLEGMFERSGFSIEERRRDGDAPIIKYICKKK